MLIQHVDDISPEAFSKDHRAAIVGSPAYFKSESISTPDDR
jgi:hypothetical protein